MPNPNLLWKQYELCIELYKHYLKLLVEFNLFYYGVTGAVVSYGLVHIEDRLVRYGMLLPVFMSILFGAYFIYGAYLMRFMRAEVYAIRDALGLQTAPELGVLTWFLIVSTTLMATVAVGVCFLVFPSLADSLP
jgi:hypothetical protein